MIESTTLPQDVPTVTPAKVIVNGLGLLYVLR